MLKAALLSLEQNILDCVHEVKDIFSISLVLSRVINPEEAEASAREAEALGADIIISYGLPPLLDGKVTSLPVFNIALSGHDVGLLLREAKMKLERPKPNIALILHACMFRRSASLGELLDVTLKIYLLDEFYSVEAAVARAADEGADMIVGVRDVRARAEERGIPALDIFSGKEGVSLALRNIHVVSYTIEMNKKSAAEKTAYLNSIFHGIIEVDRNGMILMMNDYARNLLDCKNRNIVGQPLLNHFPRKIKESLDAALSTGQQEFTLDIKLMNKNMLTNIEPVVTGAEISGAVITIQKGQLVQVMTPEMQSKVNSRGFTAKHRFNDIKSESESYQNLIKQARLSAYSGAPVLIRGEEGTETLRLAQCIHNESSRRQNGFVEVECSAWDTEHLDEMLFGSRKQQAGDDESSPLVELAEEGTLFLNHIDALKNELQFKVCRLIRGALPLGNRQVSSNIRVIAATESDLRELMEEGVFRTDLYYALNVLTLDIPPLRERREDLESWIDFFLDHYCSLYSRPIQLSRGACRCMCDYAWPGNIRQLENFCHRMVLLTPRRNIDEAFVRSKIMQLYQAAGAAAEAHTAAVCQDKDMLRIVDALKRHNGKRAETAQDLGISKTTLWRLMQKYGITTDYTI